jgi:hypothetical protein
MTFEAGAGHVLSCLELAFDNILVVNVRGAFRDICRRVVLGLGAGEEIKDGDENQQKDADQSNRPEREALS